MQRTTDRTISLRSRSSDVSQGPKPSPIVNLCPSSVKTIVADKRNPPPKRPASIRVKRLRAGQSPSQLTKTASARVHDSVQSPSQAKQRPLDEPQNKQRKIVKNHTGARKRGPPLS